jgi:hypothetical protein
MPGPETGRLGTVGEVAASLNAREQQARDPNEEALLGSDPRLAWRGWWPRPGQLSATLMLGSP